jgi:uracil phosphoribosyltransferase
VTLGPRTLFRIGPHIAAGGSAIAALRRARRSGDKLEMIDAVVSTAAVVTGVLLLVRELRKGGVGK